MGLVQHKVVETIAFDFFPIVCVAKTDEMKHFTFESCNLGLIPHQVIITLCK